MKKIVIISLILLAMFIIGCAKKTIEPTTDTALDKETSSLETETDQVNAIDSELDSSDIDNLDSELEEVNW